MPSRTKKISWKDLLLMPRIAAPLHRSLKFDALYQRYIIDIERTYSSYTDYIKIRYLQYEKYRNNNGKISSRHGHRHRHGIVHVAFTRNMFPYNLRKGISHSIIWSSHSLSMEQVKEILSKHNIITFIIHINDPNTMSIPDVWHCHVFWK